MSGDEAWFNKEQRELKRKRLLLKGPRQGTWQIARGPMGKSRQPMEGRRRERHMASLEPIRAHTLMVCFGVPGLSPHWSFEIQNSRILIHFLGVLFKVLIKGRPWEVKETVYHLGLLEECTFTFHSVVGY